LRAGYNFLPHIYRENNMASKKPAAKKVSKSATTKPAAKKVAKKVAKKTAKKVATKVVAKVATQRGKPVAAKTVAKKLKPANNKTVATAEGVDAFLKRVAAGQMEDTKTLLDMMSRITKEPAEMWGSSIVGFGHRTLTYETGRTMDWMHVAFSPRKQNMTVYILDGFPQYTSLLAKLGKHSTGKSCLYIKRLSDVNLDVLNELITRSVAHVRAIAK
jgi:hypothetical protein